MGFSVNTNSGAGQALSTLNKINNDRKTNQNRISTGKDVSSAKDNATLLNIANKLTSEVSGLNSVKASLDRATSTADVASAATQAVSDVLLQLREKAVAASDSGLDDASRQALNEEFNSLKNSITSLVDNAGFNGTNLLKGDNLSAIINDSGTSTIDVAGDDLSLGGSVVSLGASQEIGSAGDAANALSAIDASISQVGNTLSKLGSASSGIDQQRNFVSKLNDSIEIGIGNLVDSDLATESAKLESLRVKQELGLKSLSIANKAPSTVLSLF